MTGDSWRGITRRPQRSLLTILGVALGVGALVAIVGLAQSSALQISRRFDAIAATAVQVSLPPLASLVGEASLVRSASKVPGVLRAGMFTPLVGEAARPVIASTPRTSAGQSLPVVVASAQGLAAADPVVVAGRLPGSWAQANDGRLVVLGVGAARRLLLSPDDGRNVVHLDGQPFTVAAIVTDRERGAVLASAVVITDEGASVLALRPPETVLLVRTRPGSGASAARWLPLALSPSDPASVTAQVPPDPLALRGRISTDTRGLLFALGLVALAAGAVGVANTMLIAVWERRSEIGLRRALGASRGGVARLFLAEAAIVGVVGGVAGTAVGILAGSALCAVRGWAYALPAAAAAAPLLGGLVGTVAGAYPSWRASRVEPVESLRA